jgi:hypothetical protein
MRQVETIFIMGRVKRFPRRGVTNDGKSKDPSSYKEKIMDLGKVVKERLVEGFYLVRWDLIWPSREFF